MSDVQSRIDELERRLDAALDAMSKCEAALSRVNDELARRATASEGISVRVDDLEKRVAAAEKRLPRPQRRHYYKDGSYIIW